MSELVREFCNVLFTFVIKDLQLFVQIKIRESEKEILLKRLIIVLCLFSSGKLLYYNQPVVNKKEKYLNRNKNWKWKYCSYNTRKLQIKKSGINKCKSNSCVKFLSLNKAPGTVNFMKNDEIIIEIWVE